jgi:hypothetical protein
LVEIRIEPPPGRPSGAAVLSYFNPLIQQKVFLHELIGH